MTQWNNIRRKSKFTAILSSLIALVCFGVVSPTDEAYGVEFPTDKQQLNMRVPGMSNWQPGYWKEVDTYEVYGYAYTTQWRTFEEYGIYAFLTFHYYKNGWQYYTLRDDINVQLAKYSHNFIGTVKTYDAKLGEFQYINFSVVTGNRKRSCVGFAHYYAGNRKWLYGDYCSANDEDIDESTTRSIIDSIDLDYQSNRRSAGVSGSGGSDDTAGPDNVDDFSGSLRDVFTRALRGDVEAQYELGNTYKSGVGVIQNIDKAHIWYRRAAENAHVEAQYELGNLYEMGQYVSKDINEALIWYKKAADQGHALAGMALGRLQTAAPIKKATLLTEQPAGASKEETASTPQPDSNALVEQETAFWQSIQDSSDPLMFEAYMRRYPNGAFVDIARLKRDALVSPQSALQTPSTELNPQTGERKLNEEKIKIIIFEFYNNNRIIKQARPEIESPNFWVTNMLSISSMTLTQISNNLVTANLKYRWELSDATYYQRSGRGIATIEIVEEAYKVIKFETDGNTFLPINQPYSYYK